jgi:hypothetical protein
MSMKSLILFPIILLLIVSCEQNEVKTEKKQLLLNSVELSKVNLKIEQFLMDTIENLDSFIPKDGIMEIDSAFSSPTENIDFKNILSEFADELDKFDSVNEKIKGRKYIYKNSNQRVEDSLLVTNHFNVLYQTYMNINNEYIGYEENFIGWKVRYQFEIDDFKREKKYVNCIFIFDKSINSILNFEDNITNNEGRYYRKIFNNMSEDISRRKSLLNRFTIN